MVTINIGRKEMVFFSVIILVFAVVGLSVAIGSGDYTVHGHDAGEIEGAIGGGTNTVELGSFGDWTRTGTLASGGTESMVAGNVYKALSDGIIIASEGGSMIAYVDSDLAKVTNSDSSVKRVFASDSTNAPSIPSFTFPIKKGDYFKITNNYYGTAIIWWVPITSGNAGGSNLDTGILDGDNAHSPSADQVSLISDGCVVLDDANYGASDWMACPQGTYVAAVEDDGIASRNVLCCPF